MSAERKAQLQLLPGWAWDLRDAEWQQRYDDSLQLRTEHGEPAPRRCTGGRVISADDTTR